MECDVRGTGVSLVQRVGQVLSPRFIAEFQTSKSAQLETVNVLGSKFKLYSVRVGAPSRCPGRQSELREIRLMQISGRLAPSAEDSESAGSAGRRRPNYSIDRCKRELWKAGRSPICNVDVARSHHQALAKWLGPTWVAAIASLREPKRKCPSKRSSFDAVDPRFTWWRTRDSRDPADSRGCCGSISQGCT